MHSPKTAGLSLLLQSFGGNYAILQIILTTICHVNLQESDMLEKERLIIYTLLMQSKPKNALNVKQGLRM